MFSKIVDVYSFFFHLVLNSKNKVLCVFQPSWIAIIVVVKSQRRCLLLHLGATEHVGILYGLWYLFHQCKIPCPAEDRHQTCLQQLSLNLGEHHFLNPGKKIIKNLTLVYIFLTFKNPQCAMLFDNLCVLRLTRE